MPRVRRGETISGCLSISWASLADWPLNADGSSAVVQDEFFARFQYGNGQIFEFSIIKISSAAFHEEQKIIYSWGMQVPIHLSHKMRRNTLALSKRAHRSRVVMGSA